MSYVILPVAQDTLPIPYMIEPLSLFQYDMPVPSTQVQYQYRNHEIPQITLQYMKTLLVATSYRYLVALFSVL